MRKFNKNRFQKIVAVALIATISEVSFDCTLLKAYAEEKINEESNFQEGNYENCVEFDDVTIYVNEEMDFSDESIEAALSEEMDNYTGVIDETLEMELNSVGILDREISAWDEESRDEISEAEELFVEISFFDEEKNEIEAEEYFEDYCEQNDITIEQKSRNTSVKKRILQAIGIEPIEVYASDGWINKMEETTSGGKFKSTMMTCATSGNKERGMARMRVVYTADWIKDAKYNGTDYITAGFSNARVVSEDFKMSYSIQEYYWCGDRWKETNTSKCPSNEALLCKRKEITQSTNESGIVYYFDLPGDGNFEENSKTYYKKKYEDFIITINIIVEQNNTSDDGTGINIDYYHYYENKKFGISSISLGVDSSGNVGISFVPEIKTAKKWDKLTHLTCIKTFRLVYK